MTFTGLPLKSPNLLLRMHWHKRRVYFQDWYMLLRTQILPVPYPEPGKRTVAIKRIASRMMDPDNLHGACKPVLDALTRLGAIVDDGPEHIRLVVTQERGLPERVEIEIAEWQ